MSQAREAFTARTCSLARQLVGWSQVELAERSGLTAHTISNFESGRHRPRYGSITACLRAFKGAGVVFFLAKDGADCVVTQDPGWRHGDGDGASLD